MTFITAVLFATYVKIRTSLAADVRRRRRQRPREHLERVSKPGASGKRLTVITRGREAGRCAANRHVDRTPAHSPRPREHQTQNALQRPVLFHGRAVADARSPLLRFNLAR